MKPKLVIGLGNSLMGDDGIGCHIVEQLAGNPRLTEDTEVLNGGTDLLRCAEKMAGRKRVVIIDAVMDGFSPGTVSVIDGEDIEPEEGCGNAHHLSALSSISLLQLTQPSLPAAHFTLIAISIHSALASLELSPALRQVMPRILYSILQELN